MGCFFIIHSDCQGVCAAKIIGSDAGAVECIADPSEKSISRAVVADYSLNTFHLSQGNLEPEFTI